MTFYTASSCSSSARTATTRSTATRRRSTPRSSSSNPSRGEVLKEAAYAAVISWKNCLAVEDDGQDARERHQEEAQRDEARRSAKEGTKEGKEDESCSRRKPIPEKQQKMLEAFDTYIKYVPESPELPTIKYRKARIYYEYNHFDEAMPLFKDIAEHHSDRSSRSTRRTSCSTACTFKKKYDELQGDVDQFCPHVLGEGRDVEGQCTSSALGLTRKRIEIAEKEGRKSRRPPMLYMKMAQDVPERSARSTRSTTTPPSLRAAPSCIGSAIQAPRGAPQGQARLGAGQEGHLPDRPQLPGHRGLRSRGRQVRAVRREVSRARRTAPTALYSASFFRRGLGDNDKAIKDVAALRQGLRRSQGVRRQGGRRRASTRARSTSSRRTGHACRSTSSTT